MHEALKTTNTHTVAYILQESPTYREKYPPKNAKRKKRIESNCAHSRETKKSKKLKKKKIPDEVAPSIAIL